MQPVHFEGAKIIGKPENMTDEQCFSMWAMPVDHTITGEDGKEYLSRFWLEAWQPSREDIEAINQGRPIWLQLSCIRLIPIAVFTLDENGNSNAAD